MTLYFTQCGYNLFIFHNCLSDEPKNGCLTVVTYTGALWMLCQRHIYKMKKSGIRNTLTPDRLN